MIISRSTLPGVDDRMRPERVINGMLSTISLCNHDCFLEGIAMKTSRELGSALIYGSYGPTYNPSLTAHGKKKEMHHASQYNFASIYIESSGAGKPVRSIPSSLQVPTTHSNWSFNFLTN